MAKPTIEEMKPAEEITQPIVESKDEKNSVQKRIDELVGQRKELEAKVASYESEKSLSVKKAEEEKAKADGNYEALKAAIEKEKEALAQTKNVVLNKYSESVLIALGAKHGLAKAEYIKLFNGKVDMDESLEVKNLDKLEKEFSVFMKENPTLFATGKPVAKTDNKPVSDLKPETMMTTQGAYGNILSGLKNK